MFYIYVNIIIKTPASWLHFIQCLSISGFIVPPLYGLIVFIRGVLPATIINKVKERYMRKKGTENDVDTLPSIVEYCREETPLISH